MTPRQAHEDAESLIATLKQARIDSGREAAEIAERSGLDRFVIPKSEFGISQPRMTTLIRWADALDFDVRLVRREKL